MKNLLNLGKALNKAEQKSIHGGNFGISDGDCNQAQQAQISCNPSGDSSECDLDAVCVGTNGQEFDLSHGPIPSPSIFFYLGGVCGCVN